MLNTAKICYTRWYFLCHLFSSSDTNWASTVQSYSDNNAEQLASDSTGLRTLAHSAWSGSSLSTPLINLGSPGYPHFCPLWLQICVFHVPALRFDNFQEWLRTQIKHTYWFITEEEMQRARYKERPRGFITSPNAPPLQYFSVFLGSKVQCVIWKLLNLIIQVFMENLQPSSPPQMSGGAEIPTCISQLRSL